MIKNIIFDFGDIFINLDKDAFEKEMLRLGVAPYTDETMKIYHQYEQGFITTDEFISYFHQKFNIKKEEMIKAWNSILLDFPTYRFDFLKELVATKKYRLFLLSNTNDLHISWIQRDWGMELYQEFKNCFEQFYLSHEIHFRKPYKDIFQYVLNENKLLPSETIFIDDTQENTDTAKELGMSIWHLIPKKDEVVDLLKRKII